MSAAGLGAILNAGLLLVCCPMMTGTGLTIGLGAGLLLPSASRTLLRSPLVMLHLLRILVCNLFHIKNPHWVSVILGFHQGDGHQNLMNAIFEAKPVPVADEFALCGLILSHSRVSLFRFLVKFLEDARWLKAVRKSVHSWGLFTNRWYAGAATGSSVGKGRKTAVGERFESWMEWIIYLPLTYPVFQIAMKLNKWASEIN